MKKLRKPLLALAVLLVVAGGLFWFYEASASGPPALYVNGVRTIGGDFTWKTPRGTIVTEPVDLIRAIYGEENTLTASLGDTLKLRNKPLWPGLRQRAQITLYEMDTQNCYASWPLEFRPALTQGYADPGSYYMIVSVEYRSLFASGPANYRAILIVE